MPEVWWRTRLKALIRALLDAYRNADAQPDVQLSIMRFLSPSREKALSRSRDGMVGRERAYILSRLSKTRRTFPADRSIVPGSLTLI